MARTKGKCIKTPKRAHPFTKAFKAVTKSSMASKKAHKPIMPPVKVTKSIMTPTEAHEHTLAHKKADTTGTQTAAQRALSIPDILAQIFEVIAKRWGQKCTVLETGASVYQLWQYSRRILARCARVNKTWFVEATRLLWQYPEFRYTNNLSRLLRHVSPERMELYADFVQLGFIAPLSLNGLPDKNNSLDGVKFSRIRLLRLHLWSRGLHGAKFFLPLIQAPMLEVLEIDPHSLLYKPYINRGVGLELAGRCRTQFPNLRKIVFVRYAYTSKGIKTFFATHLPGVQVVWSGYKGSNWRRGWPKRRITAVK